MGLQSSAEWCGVADEHRRQDRCRLWQSGRCSLSELDGHAVGDQTISAAQNHVVNNATKLLGRATWANNPRPRGSRTLGGIHARKPNAAGNLFVGETLRALGREPMVLVRAISRAPMLGLS